MFEAAVAGALALCSKSPKHALPPLSPASPVQASSPQVQYFEPLSQEQKKHCIQLNICFRCRQHGHSSYHGSCPNNDWRARSRELPSTPSAAAQSSQLPASTTLASAPRPRRSRASPTSRPSTLKSQLESLTSQFTALGKQLVTQKVLPSKSSLFNAIFPPAPPVPVTASPTTALPPSAAPEATSPIITQPVTRTGIFAVHCSERRLNGTSRSASAHSAFSTTHQMPSSFKHSPSE